MNTSSLFFFINEALTNFRRAGLMTVVSVSTIAVSLLMMGTLLLATLNVEAFLTRLQAEAMVNAFLAPGTSVEIANNLKLQITGMEEVSQVEVITPEQAAADLFLNPEDRHLLDIGLASGPNPLPYTLRIQLRSSADLDPVLKKVKSFSWVESVGYGEEAFRQFRGLSELLWIGSLIIILIMGLCSLFIVANTIRLTLFLRQEEIIIMRLVGATNWFIRWFFVIVGFLQGAFGAVASQFLLLVSYKFILARLAALLPFFQFEVQAGHLIKLGIKLLLMGMVLGISGALITLRDLRSFGRGT